MLMPLSLSLCFSVSLGGELGDIKKRRATLASSLKNHKSEVSRSLQSGNSLTQFLKTFYEPIISQTNILYMYLYKLCRLKKN